MNSFIHSRFRRQSLNVSLAAVSLLLPLAIAASSLSRAEAKPPRKGRLPNITLFISGDAVTAGEVATFDVYLGNNDSGVPITVHYRTGDGWATVADGDYLPESGTLTFAPGETYKTVTVQTLPDVFPEYSEDFFLSAEVLKPDGSVWATDWAACTIHGELYYQALPWWGFGDPPVNP